MHLQQHCPCLEPVFVIQYHKNWLQEGARLKGQSRGLYAGEHALGVCCPHHQRGKLSSKCCRALEKLPEHWYGNCAVITDPCGAQVLKQGWQDWIETAEFLSQFTVPARALWFTGKKLHPVSIQLPMHKPHKTLWSDLPCFSFVLLRKIFPCLSLYYDCNKK